MCLCSHVYGLEGGLEIKKKERYMTIHLSKDRATTEIYTSMKDMENFFLECGFAKFVVIKKPATKAREGTKRSGHAKAKLAATAKDRKIEPKLADQFNSGHLLACISSRPGQSGRIDGYIREGKELEFYLKKTEKKK